MNPYTETDIFKEALAQAGPLTGKPEQATALKALLADSVARARAELGRRLVQRFDDLVAEADTFDAACDALYGACGVAYNPQAFPRVAFQHTRIADLPWVYLRPRP